MRSAPPHFHQVSVVQDQDLSAWTDGMSRSVSILSKFNTSSSLDVKDLELSSSLSSSAYRRKHHNFRGYEWARRSTCPERRQEAGMTVYDSCSKKAKRQI